MAKWFFKLTENARMYFVLGCIVLFGALVFLPFCLTNLLSWDWEFGFLLGSAIEALSLAFLILSSQLLTKTDSKVKDTILVVVLYTVRFLLYLGGLLLAALLTYVAKVYLFNIFAVFIGYMPMQIVVLFIQGKKKEGVECKKD